MWKAKITQTSDVDSSGNMQVIFDVLLDDKVLYPSQITIGKPESIITTIQQMVSGFKANLQNAQSIQIGDEITI